MSGPQALSVRAGHPDFLDLPWGEPVARWREVCARYEELPRGHSRHPVVFVGYQGRIYAVKELPPGVAEREYELLRRLADLRLPAVQAVGHGIHRTSEGLSSVLLTSYLDHSLPYSSLFRLSGPARRTDSLLDAMAGLLVQLHLSGVFWGDCSLANTLFRRDAGALRAYLVDAETSEIQDAMADGMREHDLDIMEENVTGGLVDLVVGGMLSRDFPAYETGASVRERYRRLWDEVNRSVVIEAHEHFRIQERIRALNELGFSVGEVELRAATDGAGEPAAQLHLKVLVTDRTFHQHQLHGLTGLDAEEEQARRMMNEIQELRAAIAEERNYSAPLSAAAWQWHTQRYQPISARLAEALTPQLEGAAGLTLPELYTQLLEHKWYQSERAGRDVGHDAALETFLAQARPGLTNAKASHRENRENPPAE